MKIAYIVNARIPTEKAHGYQIMRTCVEWVKAGHSVELIVPLRENPIQENAFSFYGLPNTFELLYIPCRLWIEKYPWLGAVAFYVQSLSFCGAILKKKELTKDTVIYSRNPEIINFFSKKGYSAFYNAHTWPRRKFPITFFLKKAKGIIGNSQGTVEAALKMLSLPATFSPNAADENPFRGESNVKLRTELDLPLDKKIIMYVGHLYAWKGSSTILECAQQMMSDQTVQFVVIGGKEGDIHRATKQAQDMGIENISFLGYKKKEIIPKFLVCADVLLLPNAPISDESIHYTSPLKLFEYIASGVPVVASDLPSIREVLTESDAFLVPAGDVEKFTESITRAFGPEGYSKAQKAHEKSKKYSWKENAGTILAFIQSAIK